MAITSKGLSQRFRELYTRSARVFRAPGRVNLIGEHTDYNDGFVLPAAIDSHVWAAIAPRSDDMVRVYSANFAEQVTFDLHAPAHPQRHWSDFVQGPARMLIESGCELQGCDLLIDGDVPMGAGLSSSAAIEVVSGFAFLMNAGLPVDRVNLAQLCRRAENEFVGAKVGIMDPFISCCGRAGHALELDCRSLAYRLLPLPGRVRLVVCNTMVKHRHAAGEYNQRRKECEEGVRLVSRSMPGIRALRDVTLPELEQRKSVLPETIYRRCRHVVSENARVTEASAALQVGKLSVLGRLMAESHRSLRQDFEVSCAELDLMVELAEGQEGVHGARMTGGGFGGSTINLVEADAVASFSRLIASKYKEKTGLVPEILAVSSSDGVGELEA